MQIRSMRTTSKPKLMIIPMIDIIFFLLVFFMMSMLSMVVQKSMPVNLPASSSAKVDLDKKISVTITADGTVYVEQMPVPMEQLVRRLQIEQVKSETFTVVLRADTKAQYGKFVEVLDTLKGLGITKIAIATDSK